MNGSSSLVGIKEFNVELHGDNLRSGILEIARQLKPEWKSIEDEASIITKDFSGGITNRIVACYLADAGVDTHDTILFRIYGKDTEKFISREAELVYMNLMKKHDLGPEIYCKFKNGMSYEYLPGRIVDQPMLLDKQIYTQIAQSMAKLHLIEFSGQTAAKLQSSSNQKQPQPFIFNKIRDLFDLLSDDYAKSMRTKVKDLIEQIPSKEQLKSEIDSLQTNLEATARHNDFYMVLSHNDLLLANIIYYDKPNVIKFIDYEYAAINYQAYDIANHFNEFAGVDSPDYSLFPSRDYQLEWLRVYLNTFASKQQQNISMIVKEELVEKFYAEVNKFTMASHMMWAVWALVQAQCSEIDFDFVAYAKIRFDEYFKRKIEWF